MRQEDLLRPEGYRQSVYSLLLCTLAINILSLALPVMTLQVYDRILPNPGTGTLPVLITGVCLAVLLEAFLRLSRSYVIGRAGAAYEHRMACGAIRKILNADLNRLGGYGIGEHLHRMGSVGKLKDFYNGYSLTVLAELAFVPVFFGLIVYIGQALALIPAAIIALFAAISFWKGYNLRHALNRRETVDDKRFNFLIEALEGIHTLKSFALERFFERRYEALEEDSTLENYKVTQETASIFNTGAVFSHIMVAAVTTAGAWFVLQGMLTTGGLIAVLLLSGRMMQPIQKALALWTRYQDFRLASKNIRDLMATPQRTTVAPAASAAREHRGDIRLRDIEFSYMHDEAPILKTINLDIKPGDAVLISGHHGSGKTTLLNLMAGTFAPAKGEILLDGENIDSYSPEELVRHVGFIRTNFLIFRGTIRDNITCFGQTDEEQAREVASLLNVDKEIAKLPGGFDTYLSGGNTDSIAPGLKQRIAIVRVLANKPHLILFDNADRSLDREGYTMIYSLLARLKGKASMVLVSEDCNIRALADRHYVLDRGWLTSDAGHKAGANIRPYKELRL